MGDLGDLTTSSWWPSSPLSATVVLNETCIVKVDNVSVVDHRSTCPGLSLSAEEIVQMNHAVSIADFALKLREKLRDINADLNTNYLMKIGQSSQIKRYV